MMCCVVTHAHQQYTRFVTRIHLSLDEAEKERFREQAEREGKSLAAWMREAARDRLAVAERRPAIETVDELRALFSACTARETRQEPEWEEHRRVIEGSIGCGTVVLRSKSGAE
jgi:hypothetical protein